jgi:chromosome segregation ATPase
MVSLLDDLGGLRVVGSIFGVLAFIVFAFFTLSTKKTKGKRSPGKNSDDEKIKMGLRVVELEKANNDLRERLRNLEMEYLERQEKIKKGETDVLEKTKELEGDLKEVYALKEMIEEYRGMMGKLKKENALLQTNVGDLTAKLKDGSARFEKERESEIQQLNDEKEEIKKQAKDMVVSYKSETENKIKLLEEENNVLKEKIKKMKEQYSAWEAIDGL